MKQKQTEVSSKVDMKAIGKRDFAGNYIHNERESGQHVTSHVALGLDKYQQIC